MSKSAFTETAKSKWRDMPTTKTVKVQLIGFLPSLTLVFITLKLCGVIDWWWLFVLAPIWVPPALFALGVVAMLAFVFIAAFVLTLLDKNR